MKKAPPRQSRNTAPASGRHKTLLPLFAVGGSLAAAQASALELGDAVVQSRLGQPLRASIAFALAPNERLSESCVSLRQGESPSGLPGIGRATITIADGALLLRGSQPIREPLVSANIVVGCPSTPNLSREYMMFIDPPGVENVAAPVAETATAPPRAAEMPQAASRAVAAEPAAVQSQRPRARRSPPRPVDTSLIGQSTRYRVQPGDSLSEITQRIKNRKMRLWDAVNVIFAANPDAFIDNDPNKLKAGSWLTIPSFDGSQPVVATAVEQSAPAAAAKPQAAGIATLEPVAEPALDPAPPDIAEVPSADGRAVTAQPVAVDSTGDLQPVADSRDAPGADAVVAPAAQNVVIPDVELEGPQTLSTSPNVTTAAAQAPGETSTSSASSLLLWLGGAGIAVILGLLLFGRSLRERFGPAPAAEEVELPIRSTWQVAESDGIEVDERTDWGPDDEATVETEALDADLVMGTGLHETADTTLGAEIGFPAPTEVDIELPVESDSSVNLLDSEAVAAEESDEYATIDDSGVVTVEQPALAASDETAAEFDEDEELDTKSIEVATIEETSMHDTHIDPSIAFEMLEQDYEDELSATMALNAELTRAAVQLASAAGQDAEESDEVCYDEDATAAMSLAAVTELDFDDSADGNAANDELELGLDEATVKMPSADEDKTREMPRKRGSASSK